jgi:hypothetical protein
MTAEGEVSIMGCMRIRIGVNAALVAIASAMWSGGLTAQQGVLTGDSAKGASLLVEARKTLGNEDKLRGVRTLQAKGSFRRIAGSNQVEGELEVLVALPDKMKRIEDMSPPGGGPAIVRIQALNGTDFWDENSGGGPGGFVFGGAPGRFGGGPPGRVGGGPDGRRGPVSGPDQAGPVPPGVEQGARGNIDPERLRQTQLRQRQADLTRLLLVCLLSTEAPPVWVGTAESPDGKADVLEIRPADGGAAIRLFLDASSHMPLMITWQGIAPMFIIRGGGAGRGPGSPGGDAQPPLPPRPQQAMLRMTMADYKDVDGIKLPHTITRGINGETNEEWSISSYKLNQTFKTNTFEQKK